MSNGLVLSLVSDIIHWIHKVANTRQALRQNETTCCKQCQRDQKWRIRCVSLYESCANDCSQGHGDHEDRNNYPIEFLNPQVLHLHIQGEQEYDL